MAGVRLGIIGCGNVTMYAFIPAVLSLEGVELVALADPTPERLRDAAAAGNVGQEACTRDWRELIGRADVDAVVIATPQRIRPAIARAAAEAGKHILAEKPLALTPAEAWGMVEAARRHGVVLATVHNYTFMPVYQMIKEVIGSGEIGRLETVILNFLSVEDRPGTAAYQPRWRHDVREAGGGVLMDMLHAVYLGWWFFDERPVRVSGFVDRRLDQNGDVEDYALVRYTLPSGQAMVNMAWGKGPGGLAIGGSEGRIILVNKDHLTHPFMPPDTVHVFGRSGERQYEPDRGTGYGHLQTVASFRDAILKGTPPAASGEDGAHVLEAVIASYKSCAIGCEVRLPLSPDDPVYQKGARGLAEVEVVEGSPIRRRGLYGVAAVRNG